MRESPDGGYVVTGEHQARYDGWYGTLSREEQAEADYVLSLNGGSHADAYIVVRLMRLERRSLFKDGLKGLGAVAGVVVALAGGAVAALERMR